MFVKKGPLEYQNVIKTYLPIYLWDGIDSSDSRDSSDSSDSSDRIDKKIQKLFTKKLFFHNFFQLKW